MFGLGIWEIVVILAVALLVLGPDKLPQVARQLARLLGEVRHFSDEIRRQVDDVMAEPDPHRTTQSFGASAKKAVLEGDKAQEQTPKKQASAVLEQVADTIASGAPPRLPKQESQADGESEDV